MDAFCIGDPSECCAVGVCHYGQTPNCERQFICGVKYRLRRLGRLMHGAQPVLINFLSSISASVTSLWIPRLEKAERVRKTRVQRAAAAVLLLLGSPNVWYHLCKCIVHPVSLGCTCARSYFHNVNFFVWEGVNVCHRGISNCWFKKETAIAVITVTVSITLLCYG
jgi:hypothetical protein